MILLTEPDNSTSSFDRKDLDNLNKQKSQTQSPQHSVRFCSIVNVREFRTVEPLTKAEKRKLWYTRRDFSRFISQDKQEAKEMRSALRHGTPAPSHFEVRGLESQLSIRAHIDAKTRRVKSLNAVIDEQERQRREGDYLPGLIRKASLKATRSSRLVAYSLAKNDAVSVSCEAAPSTKRSNINKSKKTKKSNKRPVDSSPILPKRRSVTIEPVRTMDFPKLPARQSSLQGKIAVF